jgi:hypothetical protein
MTDKDANSKHNAASSNIHRFVKNLGTRHEPDADEAFEAFQEARSQSREALMLDVRLASGRIVSFPYSSLRKAEYLPAGAIVLRFDKDEVTAEGKNLHRLRDLITEHRARFIQEGTDIERGLKDEDAVHIDRIEITEGIEEL